MVSTRLVAIINNTHDVLSGHTVRVLQTRIPLKDATQDHREKQVIEWR